MPKKSGRKFSNPVSISEVGVDAPKTGRSSIYDEVIQGIVDADGQWVVLDNGGRQPNSVQSSLTSTAKNRGIKLNATIQDGKVHVRYDGPIESEADGGDEDEAE